MKELVALRTERSKTFDLGGSKRRLQAHCGIIHYRDDYRNALEPWQDIDVTIRDSRIITAPYELTVDIERKGIAFRDKRTDSITTIELDAIGNDAGIASKPVISGNTVTWPDIAVDTDVVIEAFNTCVRFKRILKSERAPLEARFRISGELENLRVSARDADNDAVAVAAELRDDTLTESPSLTKTDINGKEQAVRYPVEIDPTISVYASESDGHITKTSGETWPNYPLSYYWDLCYNATTGTPDSSSTYLITYVSAYDHPGGFEDPPYRSASIIRGFPFFDTSALPESATIDAAVIYLYMVYKYGDGIVYVQNGQPSRPSVLLAAADYNRTHYSGDGGSITVSTITTNAYNAITLNATGRGWINKSGTTKLCLRHSRDINNSCPASGTTHGFYAQSANYSGTTRDPYIEIDYTVARAVSWGVIIG